MTDGRMLTDAQQRRAYKEAADFVGDIYNEDTPNETFHTGRNDQAAYMLEKISLMLEYASSGVDYLIDNAHIVLQEDYIIPAGEVRLCWGYDTNGYNLIVNGELIDLSYLTNSIASIESRLDALENP